MVDGDIVDSRKEAIGFLLLLFGLGGLFFLVVKFGII